MQRLVADHCGYVDSPPVRAMLLGVTPEIATMQWPGGTELLAVDWNHAMIRSVWPGSEVPKGKVICADWTAIPVVDGACDVVIGDGCFTQLSYPDGYSEVSREICRVLRKGGRFVSRFFARPRSPEMIEQVFEDLWTGKVRNIHAFRFRLDMALQGDDVINGVCLADVWDVWHNAVPEPATLAAKLGWSMETISVMETYRDVDARYHFFTVEQLRHLSAARFVEVECILPDYELGDRCPIMSLKAR